MAKIKFGMFMTDARGKVGGQVFSKNRSGAYVRTKVTPVNAQTGRQSAVRQLLSSLSQAWSGLSQLERDGFDGAVLQWSSTDIFGDIKNPTGKNLFTKLNFNLVNSGQSQVLTAPIKGEMPTLTALAIENDGTTLTILGQSNLTGCVIVVSATAPVSAGTSFFKGKFRQIEVVLGSAITATDLMDSYVAKFGAVSVDSNVAFELKVILPNGQASTPLMVKMVEG